MKYISTMVKAKDLQECKHENYSESNTSYTCDDCKLEITLTEGE